MFASSRSPARIYIDNCKQYPIRGICGLRKTVTRRGQSTIGFRRRQSIYSQKKSCCSAQLDGVIFSTVCSLVDCKRRHSGLHFFQCTAYAPGCTHPYVAMQTFPMHSKLQTDQVCSGHSDMLRQSHFCPSVVRHEFNVY